MALHFPAGKPIFCSLLGGGGVIFMNGSFFLDERWSWAASECTTVAAIRMRMEFVMRPEILLANLSHQISNKSCELLVAKEFASECEWFVDEIANISASLRKFLANGSLRVGFWQNVQGEIIYAPPPPPNFG